MGNGASSPGGAGPAARPQAQRAVKYGTPGESGAVLGAAFCRAGAAPDKPPVVVAATALAVDLYNGLTADRKLRLKRRVPLTCVDFKAETTFGFIMLAGTAAGEVLLFDAATLNEFKTFRTNGGTSGTVAAGPAVQRGAPAADDVATTAVACVSTKSFFAGHADGVVRAFGLISGKCERTFRPPSSYAPPAGGGAVTAITLYGQVGCGPEQVLAVGHADGSIHNYAAGTGAFLTTFASAPGLTQLLSLRRFSTLAAVHAGVNSLTLWDLGADRSVVLDFASELESIHRRTSKLTVCRYDDARGHILCGADDGSVVVRAVSRIEGTRDLSVSLVRFCEPSLEAQVPSRITSMWFDTRADSLFTGDRSGLVRVKGRLTGVAYADTAADARTGAEAADAEEIAFAHAPGPGSAAPTPPKRASPAPLAAPAGPPAPAASPPKTPAAPAAALAAASGSRLASLAAAAAATSGDAARSTSSSSPPPPPHAASRFPGATIAVKPAPPSTPAAGAVPQAAARVVDTAGAGPAPAAGSSAASAPGPPAGGEEVGAAAAAHAPAQEEAERRLLAAAADKLQPTAAAQAAASSSSRGDDSTSAAAQSGAVEVVAMAASAAGEGASAQSDAPREVAAQGEAEGGLVAAPDDAPGEVVVPAVVAVPVEETEEAAAPIASAAPVEVAAVAVTVAPKEAAAPAVAAAPVDEEAAPVEAATLAVTAAPEEAASSELAAAPVAEAASSSASDSIPVEEAAPPASVHEAGAGGAAPVEEAAPVTSEALVEEATLAGSTAPVDEVEPVASEAPADEVEPVASAEPVGSVSSDVGAAPVVEAVETAPSDEAAPVVISESAGSTLEVPPAVAAAPEVPGLDDMPVEGGAA